MPNSFEVALKRVDDCFPEKFEMNQLTDDYRIIKENSAQQKQYTLNLNGFEKSVGSVTLASPQTIHKCNLGKQSIE